MPLMTPDSLIPDQLGAIALAFPEGASSEPVSVRTLLGWFGYERRGRYVVGIIRGALDTVNLITEPDFDSVWLDAQIRFTRPAPRPVEQLQPDVPQQAEQPMEAPFVGGAVPDPTHRVGKLEAANRGVTSVTPDDTIERAITLMMANNFSQLPVMVGERDVKGTVSWESIARRMVVNGLREHVRDCMEPHREIASDASLFAAIPEIVQYQYVLVRDSQKKISGIITGSDLSLQFQQLA